MPLITMLVEDNPIIRDSLIPAMAELGGLTVVRACQQRNENQHVLVLTNYATAEIRKRCLDLGVDGIFDKSTELGGRLLLSQAIEVIMESEVQPKVLAVIEEKRLSGPRLNPADIISKMGVFEAREKSFEYAWLASGDGVIAALWGENIRVGANGRWFYLESLNSVVGPGGDDRNASQIERAEFRLGLLKRSFDSNLPFRAVLQTCRLAIEEVERNRNAKISTRVRDDEEWHVASWQPEDQVAVLVRGSRGWTPSADELKGARQSLLPPGGQALAASLSADVDVDSAAKAYVLKHFSSYGYQAEDVSSQDLGYDIEVRDKKGATLLRVCVRGSSVGTPRRALTPIEEASCKREKLWRLIVVADPLSNVAQHKIYKASEIPQDHSGA